MEAEFAVSGLWQSYYNEHNTKQNDKFIMDGGSISNNRAQSGGGIYVNSDGTYLNKGYIEDNNAWNLGGGIYVSVNPRVLHVSKAVVTHNDSSLGGGLWACSTGDSSKVFVYIIALMIAAVSTASIVYRRRKEQ